MVVPQNISKIKETKQSPKIEWNDKSVTAYTDLGLEVPETVCRWERRFLSKVDISKGPIERSVVAMVRLKAPDFLSKDKVSPRKEYVYYTEWWEGKDWKGVPLNPVAEHYEGVWTKQFSKPHFNEQIGEIDYYQLDVGKQQIIYTIPWSKKNVDDIIAKSVHTDKDNIVFTIKFDSQDTPWGQQPATRNQFSYEKFANWKWDDVYKFNFKPSVQAYLDYVNKDISSFNLAFEPT